MTPAEREARILAAGVDEDALLEHGPAVVPIEEVTHAEHRAALEGDLTFVPERLLPPTF